ncbi:NAD-dependent epimerase/dehydratase family protein [Frankia nepalensis]|uniref:NAD-dependent epimerase/dehydratase family protein n=1 Tax=Frankia nepalensis TaxID=1836974 RepID=A0A937UUP9_9ACTN|nr:NAD-dependent epimerase/dehydratase family protein [Frankia nepalensis]MBL7502275.1 NAD-dependent epimerase/dehydratase family protein [Frankia nepalensis]MBL7516350.1 NAD-dependent epimerase/dehydratase family protein [Frankia nepalensis]MBL7631396.1 NAD-dependent epimerase/dehydratase family protein [Frankia nepalensis]
MKTLVTGATGKVGAAVVSAALAAGHQVRALVRDPARAAGVLPPPAAATALELVQGDVTDPGSLERAVVGCELVFNAMGVPEQWLADVSLFERVNVGGSENVAKAAAAAGARRLVHTSTVNVFDAPPGGRFDESCLAATPKPNAYDRSKQRAEEAVLAAAAGTRLAVVLANSATVYGPGPMTAASMEKRMFAPAVRGLLPAVPPGGFGVVFTESLARGHLLAAERGEPGQRYILCDGHVTLAELVGTVVEVAGRGRRPLFTMPTPAAVALAATGEAAARITRRPPPLARGQLAYLRWNAHPDASRARRDLGWEPTPLRDGLRRTLEAAGLLR